MTDTTRPTVERTLRLAVTNRHITPAIERLALAILERAETAEAATARLSIKHMNDTRDIRAERDALQAEVARLRIGFEFLLRQTKGADMRSMGIVMQDTSSVDEFLNIISALEANT